jgi:hypothetical protein
MITDVHKINKTSNMNTRFSTNFLPGILGGLIAGTILGLITTSLRLAPIFAVIPTQSIILGWLTHLAISVLLGALFAGALGRWVRSTLSAMILGLIFGLVWWLITILVIWLVQGFFIGFFNTTSLLTMMIYLSFGIILGISYDSLAKRSI